ncbi:IS1595 family transposase [Wukongibacter sp. M2B1]|uniref:IS1595 family transposase n=1 Tax=Wukongibacter sp. M2B1 TaxID=3088895 RepID=UPI003D78D4E1
MPSVESVIKDIKILGATEQEEVLNYLEEIIVLGSFVTEVTDEVKENRFSRGKVCPHCDHDEVSRNGKFNGKQRYICRSCRKTFNDFTHSPRYNSKKDTRKWVLYAKCMINGYSIRKCAEIVGISVPTSFYWRHKIIDAIRTFMGMGSVGGVVEVDETFFRESFKGNHKKSKNFIMPRKSRKRGTKGRKRGISNEQVCVLCAMDRVGNIMTELICKGRMKHTDIERFFNDKIDGDAIFCTDSHKSYLKFAQNTGVELKQIKRGRHKEGVYHIQHINYYHSKLKKWMDRFNGVATKYLSNYMYWFKWLQYFDTEKDTIKSKYLIVQSHTSHCNTKLEDFKTRKAIFI